MKLLATTAFASTLTLLAGNGATAATLSAADISGLELGLAGGHAIVGIGADASLNINSGPITGSALVGGGSTFTTSGGGSGSIDGGLFSDDPSDEAASTGLETDPSFTLVGSSVTVQAKADAEAVAAYAGSLTPDLAYGSNINNTTFSALGSLTVISVAGDVDDVISFSGSAEDIFVIRVAGQLDTNSAWNMGSVQASNVLWVLEGTSGQCFKTAGGNTAYGTFLATGGCDFQFSSLQLTGALINTAGHIQHVSGSQTTSEPFTTPEPIPLPAPVLMLGGALAGLGAMRRLRKQG